MACQSLLNPDPKVLIMVFPLPMLAKDPCMSVAVADALRLAEPSLPVFSSLLEDVKMGM